MPNNGRPPIASIYIFDYIRKMESVFTPADMYAWFKIHAVEAYAESIKALARAGNEVEVHKAARQHAKNQIKKVVKVLDKGPKTVTNPGVIAMQERQKRERGETK